jgi:hypothetical protein
MKARSNFLLATPMELHLAFRNFINVFAGMWHRHFIALDFLLLCGAR